MSARLRCGALALVVTACSSGPPSLEKVATSLGQEKCAVVVMGELGFGDALTADIDGDTLTFIGEVIKPVTMTSLLARMRRVAGPRFVCLIGPPVEVQGEGGVGRWHCPWCFVWEGRELGSEEGKGLETEIATALSRLGRATIMASGGGRLMEWRSQFPLLCTLVMLQGDHVVCVGNDRKLVEAVSEDMKRDNTLWRTVEDVPHGRGRVLWDRELVAHYSDMDPRSVAPADLIVWKALRLLRDHPERDTIGLAERDVGRWLLELSGG